MTTGKSGKEIVQAIKENKAKKAQTTTIAQKATNEAQLFGNSEQLQAKSKEPTAKEAKNITFIDAKGKEREITKQVQEQWLETFGLKNLDQSYIPKHSQEIQQALGGKEIKLQKGSLLKLVSQGREQYIPQIKEVLDNPEAIIRDSDDGFLFIRHLKNDDFFVNVSYDKGEYLVSISNGIKETRNLKNKLDMGGEIIYQSPSFSSSRNKLLQTSQYSANTIDNAILPQNANTMRLKH
ncbi:MAG: hypothetical protein MSA68_01365 [Helicobacter sp.]|nr:hypothetical protein [Helicobacter sp.]